MPYGPFPTWTAACRAFLGVIKPLRGEQPLVEVAAALVGVSLGIDLVQQFLGRGVVERAGGHMANPMFQYTGRAFGSEGVDE